MDLKINFMAFNPQFENLNLKNQLKKLEVLSYLHYKSIFKININIKQKLIHYHDQSPFDSQPT